MVFEWKKVFLSKLVTIVMKFDEIEDYSVMVKKVKVN